MSKFSFVFFLILICSSCSRQNKQLLQHISPSDSIAINFFKGDGTMDSVAVVKIVKDKKTIEQLMAFVSGRSTANKNFCGYDGSLHFFKNNMVMQDIDFRMNDDDCMLFSFRFRDEAGCSVMSKEAKELLEQIRARKD